MLLNLPIRCANAARRRGAHVLAQRASSTHPPIELRSDTFTKPTDAMRRAMYIVSPRHAIEPYMYGALALKAPLWLSLCRPRSVTTVTTKTRL
jgi:hypothetical protein